MMKRKDDFLSKREDSDHSSDYSLEILYDDSFEDRPLDDRSPKGDGRSRRKKKKKRLPMQRWKKITLGVVTTLLVIIIGIAGSFFYLRAQGEKNLKTDLSDVEDTPETRKEGLFITYKGKEYQYNEDVINFLCLGIDNSTPVEQANEIKGQGLADAIILVSINVESGKIKILAVPRDTYVPVKVYNDEGKFLREKNMQLTLQYYYGKTAEDSCELMVNAVSNLLFKVPIQRYCAINLEAIPILNDAIGGVDVQVLEDVEVGGKPYHAGDILHLQGKMAEDYIRDRNTDVFASSMGRLERQKQYMTNYFATAMAQVKGDLTLPVSIYQSLQGNMYTNVSVEDITYLVPELLDVALTAEDMSMIPGEVTQPDEHEAYMVNSEQLKELVVNFFYVEVL
ncbi:LCP family protein [Sporofaciens sp. JLR.KK001]|uniref:LCP family protein n=1 Tax=Sporofaciens sp. JLR.KK001 TaxID=3112621 RepID=UPI002FF19A1F